MSFRNLPFTVKRNRKTASAIKRQAGLNKKQRAQVKDEIRKQSEYKNFNTVGLDQAIFSTVFTAPLTDIALTAGQPHARDAYQITPYKNYLKFHIRHNDATTNHVLVRVVVSKTRTDAVADIASYLGTQSPFPVTWPDDEHFQDKTCTILYDKVFLLSEHQKDVYGEWVKEIKTKVHYNGGNATDTGAGALSLHVVTDTGTQAVDPTLTFHNKILYNDS